MWAEYLYFCIVILQKSYFSFPNKFLDFIFSISTSLFTVQPYEFCSDVFLLPLGSPPKDTLDLTDSEDEGAERLPPNPPPLDPAIYEILMQSLDNNNRPPPIRTKHKLNTIQEARDNVEHFI